jgi:glycosyltransferase involved in cell wall biosynthesis
MRVLMITSSYPVPGDPSWGPFIRDHARAVRERGHDVTILAPSLRRGLRILRDGAGLRVVAYPYAPGMAPMLHCENGMMPSVRRSRMALLQVPGFILAGAYYLRICAGRYRPDVIHAHWFIPGGLAAAVVRPHLGIPLVTLGHGADFHLPVTGWIRRILAFVHNRSDVSIAVSRYIRERAGTYGLPADEIRVVPNGVDTEMFTPSPSRRDGPLVIGVARRLVPEKRVGDVMDALEGLPRDTRLLIAGDGPEMGRLRRRARGRAEFLGPLPHEAMPAFLRGLDVLVNPSGQEGLSVGNLEAMACGVPVVACRGVGNDEVIEDGRSGILYRTGDVGDLRDALGRVRRRMGEEARRIAVERFSLARVAADWEMAYREALG